MIRWRIRKFFRSLDNYRRGFKFGYVRRCRVCDHTAYYPRHPDHSGEVKEATCRRAYAAAGWPDLWAYDFMPKWLRPAWHHETEAYHVPRGSQHSVAKKERDAR
jgi:hypothetical protein